MDQKIDIPPQYQPTIPQPKNNIYIYCNKNPGLCIYIGWCIIVTFYLIIYYFSNRNNLTDDEYIEEFKKLGYKDIKEAESRYKQIQNDINNYANSKVTKICYNIYSKSEKNKCNDDRNTEIEKFKADYKINKLNDNERELLSLYKKQNIYSDIGMIAVIGYIGIPLATIIIANMPWWYYWI